MPRFEEEIRIQRIAWFIELRWVALAGGLAILWVGPWVVRLNVLDIRYGLLTILLLALGFLNAFYRWNWKRMKTVQVPESSLALRARSFLHLQMAADLCILTLLLFFSGGVENPLAIFYLFHLAISTILFSRKESLAYALSAIAAPWLLFFLEPVLPGRNPWMAWGVLSPDHQRAVLLAYSLVAMGLWFFLTTLAVDLRIKEEGLKETGERLTEANDELKQLDFFKNRFLKQVVYQLKNPVMEVGLNLGNIEKNLPSHESRAFKGVESARQQVWGLLQLIEDLTWLSRARAQDLPFKKEWINVHEELVHIIQSKEAEASAKTIHFQVHGDAQIRLWADRESFGKVADNILSNAIQYTPAGWGDVLVEFEEEEGMLRLVVEDHGIGIPPKAQKKLFEEFYRGASAKLQRKFGTGLGLCIVKYILVLHGGQIAVKSGPPKGTRVEIEWPIGKSVPAETLASDQGVKQKVPLGTA